MGQARVRTGQAERISTEQLQGLDRDEQASMLFYLSGYLGKSKGFQEALTAAYAAQMRSRTYVAELRAARG